MPFQAQRANGSLQTPSAGLLNASTEIEIILSIEFSLPLLQENLYKTFNYSVHFSIMFMQVY